jgi:NAD(P)-dependent dehydrogenase (short-subunit alcohol dehydrogenase family)
MVELSGYFRLDGQVAAVTGGASGIGDATAQVLASAGAAVVIGDIDEEGAQRTAKQIEADGGRAVALRADTSRRADVDALVDRAVSQYGQLDVMCNVAGIGYAKPVSDITDDDFDRLVNINLKGVLLGCQAALRVMTPRHSGCIVNVSSTAIDCPYPNQALYGMTKAGVAYLTQVLGVEAAANGIRVNAIAPGSTPTNFGRFRYADGKVDAEAEAQMMTNMEALTPLGFLGEAMDQALLILYLASPAARWATGNIWRVNGGQARPW